VIDILELSPLGAETAKRQEPCAIAIEPLLDQEASPARSARDLNHSITQWLNRNGLTQSSTGSGKRRGGCATISCLAFSPFWWTNPGG
jgi:hypothetical protein